MATTLPPSLKPHGGSPAAAGASGNGASRPEPARRVPEKLEKVLMGADPNKGAGERRIQTSAAAGRWGEEVHGQEDEVNHHQHGAWGRQRGVGGSYSWSKEGHGFNTWCGLD